MNRAVKDNTAITFAEAFYDVLGYDNIEEGERFQRAFDEGIVAIKLEGLSGDDTPVVNLWSIFRIPNKSNTYKNNWLKIMSY